MAGARVRHLGDAQVDPRGFRSSGLSSISGSIRCRELRFASSTVGLTASIGPGAWWMANPIQLLPASVAPTCAAFLNTIRCVEPHTVRGAMAGALRKKLGLEAPSEKVENGGRVYKLPAA